jgi:hypothetical protein
MIIDELNKKISDIEELANDKTGSLESKVNDLTDGILMVADAVDIIPEMVDEKLSVVTKEIIAVKDAVQKVKTIKGDKGDKGEQGERGEQGLDGIDGINGSPDSGKDIAGKLNKLENVIDPKVIKGYEEYVNKTDLNKTISTLENQTRFLIQSNASKGTGGGTGLTAVEHDSTLTGAGTTESPLSVVATSASDVAITVRAATKAALAGTWTYNNGTSGVGATLTRTTNGVLPNQDGISLSDGDRFLIKNQASTLVNGVYVLTQKGVASVSPTIFTRATDADTTAQLDELVVTVSEGSTLRGTVWGQQTNNPVVGTSAITFATVPSTDVTQATSGTQVIGQIPTWTGTARQLLRGDALFKRDPITKETIAKRTFDLTVNNTVLEIPVVFYTDTPYTGTFNPGDIVETRFGESTGTLLDLEVITVPNQTSFTNKTYTGTWSGGLTPGGYYTGSYGTYAYNLEITDTAAEELFVTAVSGTFTPGETVTGGTSGETAIVITQVVDGSTYLYVKSASGPFTLGETITGGTSGQTAVYQTLYATTDIFTMTAPGGTIVGAVSRANRFAIDGISVGVDSYTGTLGDEFDFDTVFGDRNIYIFYITGFSGSLFAAGTRLNNLTVTGNTNDGGLNAIQSLITTGAAVTTFDFTTQTQTSTGTIGSITGDDYTYEIISGSPSDNDAFFVGFTLFFIRSVTSGPVTTTITTGYVTLDDIGQSLPGSGILATSGSDKVFAGVYDASSLGGTNKSFGVVSTINSVDSAYFFPVADGTAGQVLSTDGSGNLSFTSTGGIQVPVGTTGERVAVQGMIRYNTTTSKFEGYDGAVWQDFY